MNNVTRSIFRAIHEGKWLSIEYKNQQTQQTKYWVAVKGLNPRTRTLTVDGLHLKLLTVQDLTIHIDRIQAAEVVDGSWCPVNETLVADIRDNPGKYTALFANSANLRVLDYLAACNRLDATPYQTNYSLVHAIDADRFDEGPRTPSSWRTTSSGSWCSGSSAGWMTAGRTPPGPVCRSWG